MDVTLPDGTVIRGVPDGTTKEQLYAKLQKNGYDVSKLSPPKPLHGPELAAKREAEALDARRTEQTKPKAAPVAPVAPPRTLIDDAISVANATGDALAPYGVAAGAGGGAGALVGGVGAPFGALAGVTGLALGDVGAAGYNLAAPMFGGQPMTAPSEAIRQQFRNVGLTKPAEDPMGRVVFNALNTGAASIGGGNMMRMGGELLKKAPGVLGSVGNFFATPVTAASSFGAGVTGGATQQVATEMGAPKPVADILGLVGSLPGGGMGDKLAGIRPTPPVPAPSGAQLAARTGKAYDLANSQGVEWTPATISQIAEKAAQDAISPGHPDGPLPLSALSAPIRDVLRGLADAAETHGRVDSRELDFWRKKLNEVIGVVPATTGEKAVAIRVREGLDELTSQSDLTLNNLRASAIPARVAMETAEAEAKRLAGTPGEATAIADAAAARKAYDAASAKARATDPDVKELATKTTSAVKDAGIAKDALAREQAAHMTAESNLAAAQATLAAKTADMPNNPILNRYQGAVNKAQKAVNDGATSVAQAQKAFDDAAASAAKLTDSLTARERALAGTKNDTPTRVAARNEALNEGRETYPVQSRTQDLERMPEAASISAAGASGDMAAALRQQVRTFIREQGDAGMRRLPEATRRALDHFAAGGRLGQRTLELIGRLSPGGGSRHALGNAFTAAQSGIGFLFGGGAPGAIALPLAGAAATTAARGAANRGAENEFARLRDLVARGDNAKPKPSPNTTKKVVNYMLADQLTADPKR